MDGPAQIALLLLQLSWWLMPAQSLHCPDPFKLESGVCVFVNATQKFTWCSANRMCASIGGELINSHESIRVLKRGNITSANCGCELWIGLSELADYRGVSTSGWQRVNGKGDFPDDRTLLDDLDGSTGEVCLRRKGDGKIADMECDRTFGFICEFVPPAVPTDSLTWVKTAIDRTKFNLPNSFCFADLPGVPTESHCVEAATRARDSRQVLHNSKLRLCRLLLFTDSLQERGLATSADWVKYQLL